MGLWYASRGTGEVLVVLLTLSTALGVLATARAGSARWPRFATQDLHRNVSLLGGLMLIAHVTTLVLHEFVDVRWYHAFVPIGGDYVRQERLPMTLGALAFDLFLLITLTSLIRGRLPHRLWRGLHLFTYLGWGLGMVHGLLIGTDAGTGWGRAITYACLAVVAVAVVIRIGTWVHEHRRRPAPLRNDLADVR